MNGRIHANGTSRPLADSAKDVCPTGWANRNVVRPSVGKVGSEVVPSRRVVCGLVTLRPNVFTYLKLHQIDMASGHLSSHLGSSANEMQDDESGCR